MYINKKQKETNMTKLNKAFRDYAKGTKTEKQLEKLMDAIKMYLKENRAGHHWSSDTFKDWYGTFRNAKYYLEINKLHSNICLGERKPNGNNVYTSFDEVDLENLLDKFLGLA